MTPTQIDRIVMAEVTSCIRLLHNETQKHINEHGPQGATVSHWFFLSSVINKARTLNYKLVTPSRIKRLCTIGWISQEASDGFGPSIKINNPNQK